MGGTGFSMVGTFCPADRRSPWTVYPMIDGPGDLFSYGPGGLPDGGTINPATPVTIHVICSLLFRISCSYVELKNIIVWS